MKEETFTQSRSFCSHGIEKVRFMLTHTHTHMVIDTQDEHTSTETHTNTLREHQELAGLEDYWL